jgi:hypothetical protein
VPKSALDFLKPQFKGKLISAYPADDDATLYDFYTIVRKYGWSYMDRYMAREPKFIQGHLGVARSLGSGESLVTFDNTTGSTNTVKREGGKIELAAPVSDRLPMFFTSEAILKDAPHPNAAKLYVSWFLGKEQQSRIGVYSSRSDVPPPAGLMPLSGYRLAGRANHHHSRPGLSASARDRPGQRTEPDLVSRWQLERARHNDALARSSCGANRSGYRSKHYRRGSGSCAAPAAAYRRVRQFLFLQFGNRGDGAQQFTTRPPGHPCDGQTQPDSSRARARHCRRRTAVPA